MPNPSKTPFIRRVITGAHACSTTIREFGLAKGIWLWLRLTFSTSKLSFTVHRQSPPFEITLRGQCTDLEVYKKIFVDQEYRPPMPLAAQNILDLGANTGMASLYFHFLFPDASIVAVEPDVDNFAMLQRNTSHLPNVTCIHGAAWSRDGHIQLQDPGIGAWGYRATDAPQAASTASPQVPCFTLDTLIQTYLDGRCDLLKIDVEGAEKEIFANPGSSLDAIRSIVIELHDRYTPGCSRSFFSAVAHLPSEQWIGENVWVWRE